MSEKGHLRGGKGEGMSPEKNNPVQNREPDPNYRRSPGTAADTGVHRDPEDRPARNEKEIRDKSLDKTIADSFPTSDPPSSIPDPGEDEAA